VSPVRASDAQPPRCLRWAADDIVGWRFQRQVEDRRITEPFRLSDVTRRVDERRKVSVGHRRGIDGELGNLDLVARALPVCEPAITVPVAHQELLGWNRALLDPVHGPVARSARVSGQDNFFWRT
jgi:hypothetical protein